MSETENIGAERYRSPSLSPKLYGNSFSDFLQELLVGAGVEVQQFASEEAVFREGDPGGSAFFIHTGSVDIVCQGSDGKEQLLNRLGKGELFGEMALLDETQRSASALTREGTELFVVTRDEMMTLLRREPQMGLWMLERSSHRLRVLTRMISQMELAHKVNFKILAAQEAERRRIGRDVHDGVAQSFTVSILRLQAAVQFLDRDPDQARSILEGLEDGLRDSLDQIRELIRNLFPKALRSAGLVGAIDQFLERVARSDDLEIAFEPQCLEDELPAILESTLFCIVQEAINNVKKHAGASAVRIDLRRDDHTVALTVEDNGCGFDPNRFSADSTENDAYGLLSMQERAELAGGTMEIDSRHGAGTTLRFLLPVHAPRTRSYP